MKPLLALIAVAAIAQEPRFRSETKIVQVPVSVIDARGRTVDGLRSRDFTLLDDGVPRAFSLDTFSAGAAPISLVVAIQSSGISNPAIAKIRRIGSMIQPLVIGRRGEAAIVTFDDDVTWRQEFTSDAESIRSSVRTLRGGYRGQSRLFDAVVQACARMKDRSGRKVLMLISESRDRGSGAKIEHAIHAVTREGVEVFAAPYSAGATTFTAKPEDLPPPSSPNYFAIFGELFRLAKTNDADALTQATGGSVFPFLRERAAEKAIEMLGVEVHSQYILSFPQSNAGTGMHQIEVITPEHASYKLRSRRAYWAD